MPITGYYYLHTDGDLIFKSAWVVESDPAYFDSDFVRKKWPVDPSDRASAWIICTEALAMGANEARVLELAAKWQLTDDDAQVFAERSRILLGKDGDRWYAMFEDFENVHFSQVGFGIDCLHALAELARLGIGTAAEAEKESG